LSLTEGLLIDVLWMPALAHRRLSELQVSLVVPQDEGVLYSIEPPVAEWKLDALCLRIDTQLGPEWIRLDENLALLLALLEDLGIAH
jgi:hypothetical protein